jgi:hypothetical protein
MMSVLEIQSLLFCIGLSPLGHWRTILVLGRALSLLDIVLVLV